MTIAYDGTNYNGWQVQPNGCGIQELLEKALGTILRSRITVHGAGRTDAGVHALGQTAHFATDPAINLNKTLYSLNGILPKDIRVTSIEPKPEDFHARFSAKGKIYHYFLTPNAVVTPFLRLYRCHVKHPVDLNLLREAAKLFIGTHDFSAFANEQECGSAKRNPIRTIYRLEVMEEPTLLRLEFEGSGFLYKMVRNITGSLLAAAGGKMTLKELALAFKSRDRKNTAAAAPACGLFLVKVLY